MAAHELGTSVLRAPAELVPDATPHEEVDEEVTEEVDEEADGLVIEGGDPAVVPSLDCDELIPELDDMIVEVLLVEFSVLVDLDLDFPTSELPLGLLLVGFGFLVGSSV